MKYCIEPTCADRATLVAEQVAVRFTSKCQNDDDDFQLYPCFNGLPSESLDDHTLEVEALVAESKDDEKKLIGPRLVRRLGEFLARWLGESCTCQTSQNLKDTN